MTTTKTIRQVCEEIAADMEIDAREFDGKPFNGRTVAEYFGNQGAAIAALAKITAEHEARLLALDGDVEITDCHGILAQPVREPKS